MNDEKIDDADSAAPTLKPAPRFSQRITVRIVPEKQTPVKTDITVRYKFILIGIIIVTIIISAIIIITKQSQSHTMPERSIFNLSPIVIPTDSVPINIIESFPIPTASNQTIISKPIIKKIEVKKKPTDKDYGI